MRTLISLLATLTLLLLLQACGSTPETVLVREQARTIEPTREPVSTQPAQDPFTLRIGETLKPGSMDPLFAHNAGAQRLIRFLYDGLTGLDADGRAVPLLAESWEVSADSLHYTFILREDAFFHDDPAFAAGRGRSIQAEDVAFVFRRMAQFDVPIYAATLFSTYIKGLESFLLEERNTFFERDVLFGEISGIEVIDERRVRFTLNAPEPNFPALLASPYAVIYPKEVFEHRSTGLHSNPVGTGKFQFVSVSGDSLIVLERNFGDFLPERVGGGITSAEFKFFDTEAALFTAMGAGRVDLIPQMGPQTSKTLLAENNTRLSPGFDESYVLVPTYTSEFGLYFVENNFARKSAADAAALLRPILTEAFAAELPPNLSFAVHPRWAELLQGQSNAGASTRPEILAGAWPAGHETYTAAWWLNQLRDRYEPRLLIVNRPSRDFIFYAAGRTHAQSIGLTAAPAVTFTQQNFALHRNTLRGITFSNTPWWISLEAFETE